MGEKIKVTYFGIEAAAEKVRLTLAMCNKEFEDHRITFADWAPMKASTPYGQLPTMEIDGKVVAQGPAMMRWVARKYDTTGTLLPADADQLFAVEELCALSDDMQKSWGPALYLGMGMHQNFGHPAEWPEKEATVKALREKFIAEHLPKFMGYLKVHLDKHGGQAFLCGAQPTLADLQWLPQLRYFCKGVADHVPKECLDQYPYILEWMQRMYAVPQIKAWYKM